MDTKKFKFQVSLGYSYQKTIESKRNSQQIECLSVLETQELIPKGCLWSVYVQSGCKWSKLENQSMVVRTEIENQGPEECLENQSMVVRTEK